MNFNDFHFNLDRNTKLMSLTLSKELWRTAGYTHTTLTTTDIILHYMEK